MINTVNGPGPGEWVVADCPDAKPYATGGGAVTIKNDNASDVGDDIQSAGPANAAGTGFASAGGPAFGWRARQEATSGWTITVYAICTS